jgi:hypothetical protein
MKITDEKFEVLRADGTREAVDFEIQEDAERPGYRELVFSVPASIKNGDTLCWSYSIV